MVKPTLVIGNNTAFVNKYYGILNEYLVIGNILIVVPKPSKITKVAKLLPKLPIREVNIADLTEEQRFNFMIFPEDKDHKIIISTAKSLLANFSKLSLIICLEEDSYHYKVNNINQLLFHGVYNALIKSNINNIPLFLVSNTPSLRSLLSCQLKEYHLVVITDFNPHDDCHLTFLDLKQHNHEEYPLYGIFTKTILDIIEYHLNHGNRILIYYPKIGYASSLRCKICQWTLKCLKCHRNMVCFLQPKPHLKCHYCAKNHINTLSACPMCSSLLTLGEYGSEMLHAQLSELFPNAKIMPYGFRLSYSDNYEIIVVDTLDHDDLPLVNVFLPLIFDDALSLKNDTLEKYLKIIYNFSLQGTYTVLPTNYLASDEELFKLMASKEYYHQAEYLLTKRYHGNTVPYLILTRIWIKHLNASYCQEIAQKISKWLDDHQIIHQSPRINKLVLKHGYYCQNIRITATTNKEMTDIISKLLNHKLVITYRNYLVIERNIGE